MLRVNVGLSRKLSRDYNSTGFSVNLEGELSVGLDDPEAVVERIKEFYDVAEETLAQQIERYESESAIASRDEDRGHSGNRPSAAPAREAGNAHRGRNGQVGNGRRGSSSPGEPATNKQIQFLLTLGKRQGLTKPQLESRVADIIGREVGLYDLSKKEAGVVLDKLTEDSGSRSGRR